MDRQEYTKRESRPRGRGLNEVVALSTAAEPVSRPRACGLKRGATSWGREKVAVALVGVWIETESSDQEERIAWSRPRGVWIEIFLTSLPACFFRRALVGVCGLKLSLCLFCSTFLVAPSWAWIETTSTGLQACFSVAPLVACGLKLPV